MRDIMFLSRYSDIYTNHVWKGEIMELYQVQSDSCQLQVYSVNPTNSQNAILFLHGGPGSGAKAIMDLPVFEQFNKNYHCLFFDQRGSGLSLYDLSKGLTVEQITSDVLQVVKDAKKRFHIEHLFLWGGSFGGLLACLCIQKFALEFDGVILSSPAITFSRQQSLDFYNHMKKQYTSRLGNALTQSEELPETYFSLPEVRQFILSESNPSNSLKHICAMSDWFYHYHFDGLFHNSSLPILIMQGKNDPICSFYNIDNELKQYHMHHIEYHLFENCGHEIFNDHPKAFINYIETFIRRILSC